MYIYVSSIICIYVTLLKGICIMLQLNLKCKFTFALRCSVGDTLFLVFFISACSSCWIVYIPR
jgi:hypothetical protein